jgi:flagellar hook-associated protein FlgK
VNGTAATVNVGVDSSNNLQITSTLSGSVPDDITQAVSSGTLGGIREARDSDITATASGLDQLAYNLSNAVNTVQSAGYGLDGVT